MADQGMIIDVDYNITKAEAKQNKLNREMEISRQKAENISNEIDNLNNKLETEKQKQNDIIDSLKQQRKEAAELEKQIEKVKSGDATIGEFTDLGGINGAEKELNNMVKTIQKNEKELEKVYDSTKKTETAIEKQNVALDKQNAKTAEIAEKLALNGNNQTKFNKALKNSTKGVTNFSKRISGLAKRVLIFSVITMALRALRKNIGELLTETGTKSASLIARLRGNLAIMGRTIYEFIRPALEYLLEKLVYITDVITYGLANVLGKSVEDMRNLAKQTKKTGEEAKKATAGFDTLQTIDTSKTNKDSDSAINFGSEQNKPNKYVEDFNKILNLAGLIGLAIAGWYMGSLVNNLGLTSISKYVKGIGLIAAGAGFILTAILNWNEGLHSGENTLNSVLGTIGTILSVVGLIIVGISAWPVTVFGLFLAAGIWFDNFKDKVDDWLDGLPAGLYDLLHWFINTAYGIWNTLKQLVLGAKDLILGDWEKGFTRIGITALNALVYMLNAQIDFLNLALYPIRALVAGVARVVGADWTIRDVAIPHIPTMSYPALSTGAILPGGSPMLAWVNDQPKGQPYLEGSIDNIAAAFEKYLGGNSFGPQNVNIRFTGTLAQLAQVLAPEISTENNRASAFAKG